MTNVRKMIATIYTERIKYLRTEKGLSQEDLAKELGVSNAIISRWENGLREPSMSSLIALAKFFHVSIDYIVGLTDD